MLVYRIGATHFINDLSGTGSFLHGGRWNRKGTYLLYTAESIALAAWEYFVHLEAETYLSKSKYSVITLQIPNSILELGPASYPSTDLSLSSEWQRYAIVGAWVHSKEYLTLRVPSAVIPGSFNYLIDPLHPDMNQVSIVEASPYIFDERAFGKSLLP